MKGRPSLGKVSVAACIRSCVATAALCLGAARAGAVTVESNTKLSGDTDWTGQGAVTIAADATLDLNGYDYATKGVFSLDGGGRECASGTIGGVFPEAGATITVDVSKRLSGENRIRGDKMIATWTERPEDVNFVLDGESLAAGFELLVEDGGLRLSHKGFLILVK